MNQLKLKKIIQNNQIQYKYIIEKSIESGIVLLGWEVKSVRDKTIAIDHSYVSVKNGEAYIYNSVFQVKIKNNNPLYNPTRIRKLLLKKKELLILREKINKYRYTAVVLNLFWKNSWIKASIGIAKGKKKYDKRDLIIKNQWKQNQIYIKKYINK